MIVFLLNCLAACLNLIFPPEPCGLCGHDILPNGKCSNRRCHNERMVSGL